jgi:periplasmic protein CpxP/Spy
MMRYGMGPGAGMGPGCMASGACAGMGPGNGRGPGFGPGAAAGPGAFVEGRLAALKSELKITPAQEGTWNAYADQAKKQADAMQALHTQMREGTAATLPERLELRSKAWKQREAQAEATRQKVTDLYAALSAEQKSIADQRLAGFGAGMHGGPGYRAR